MRRGMPSGRIPVKPVIDGSFHYSGQPLDVISADPVVLVHEEDVLAPRQIQAAVPCGADPRVFL